MKKPKSKKTIKTKKTSKVRKRRKNPEISYFSKGVEDLVKKGYRIGGTEGNWYYLTPLGNKSPGTFPEIINAWDAAVKFERLVEHELGETRGKAKAEATTSPLSRWKRYQKEQEIIDEMREMAKRFKK